MRVEERFWAKVNKSDECWVWTAATNSKGYGSFAGRRIIGRADSATLMLAELTDGGLSLVVVPDGTTDIAKASPRI